MGNFDFLKKNSQFEVFSDAAITAEALLFIDPSSSVINCRKSLEFAVKWMYSVDSYLEKPYDDRLASLMDNEEFRSLVGKDIWQRTKLIRQMGNNAVHSAKKITEEQAALCIENLYVFLDYVAYCYDENYQKHEYVPVTCKSEVEVLPVEDNVDLQSLITQNILLKGQYTSRRQVNQDTYTPLPLELSEYKTRKIYIDTMLVDAGWIEGKDWINEVKLLGMPNKSDEGFADYVLYGEDGRSLAIIEAKKTCVDVSKGRQQAKLYADILEKIDGRRPVVFLSNGFDTRIDDGQYPERRCSCIYSKRDIEKMFNLRRMRTSLNHINIDENIAGRYYQKSAIRSVCDAFDRKNRRKALLVMATGSGKTRTVIELCNVLMNHGWIRNILFLADRTALITQAKRSFVNLLPELSVVNLVEDKDNYNARCVFSTYNTMMNCIDSINDDKGKIFTCGHFDLIICDEAHRSIYNKYQDIFNYFDAPLVGLTATPKDDIDKNTYDIFELENGVPTYGYDLAAAVQDGYLVDFVSIETKMKFLQEGISYDELSDEEKDTYEETFEDENGNVPDRIESSALNEWVFNEDTIKTVLNTLMTKGLRVEYGQKIGKSVIFAKNHLHAEKILAVFNKEYPNLPGYAKVIDNYMTYAQSAIDEFSTPDKLPQIAISVDMLDTGIDVPEILNLVFFKKVMSKAKFWQMIGRGTRLCEGLLDGADKKEFYIFDFCSNFEFFRINDKGKQANEQINIQGALFRLKAQIIYKLQDMQYQTQELVEFRETLIDEILGKVKELNRDNFAVRQHIRYVDTYSKRESYQALTYHDTLVMESELMRLIMPDDYDPKALRFDALMYGIELCYLSGKSYKKGTSDLKKKVLSLTKLGTIPEVMARHDLIQKIISTSFLDTAEINDFEYIREQLRDLIKYIPYSGSRYDTDFTDSILSEEWNASDLDDDSLKNYKAKAEAYIRNHQDKTSISKLKNNEPLESADIEELEAILWSTVGTKDDYISDVGSKPLGEFVREIVGLDMNAAKEAFSYYLNEANLNSNQIYFVNQIVEYIVKNGVMKDFRVLQGLPFTAKGRLVDLFAPTVWSGIMGVIKGINENAQAA